MADNDALEFRALNTLVHETLFRADARFAYLLNAGEPGFVETLKPLTAQLASQSPGPGRKPIVSHANHVLYGIELANRALAGEKDVHQNADWSLAWKLETVNEHEWKKLVERLDQESQRFVKQINEPRKWDEISLTGVFSVPAHTAYHLGAIRQMLLELKES